MGGKHDIPFEGTNVIRVFQNRTLRRIFGPMTEDVKEDGKLLYELHKQ
jgi:hypothetical protein